MPVIRTRSLRHSFGAEDLLDDVSFSVERGERICLVGRNGCGKSTLLKLLEGRIIPEEGIIERKQALAITALPQELPELFSGPVFDCVATGLGSLGKLVRRFHELSNRLASDASPQLLEQLESVQHELETSGGWALEQQVETTLSRLSLDPDARCEALSGGL